MAKTDEDTPLPPRWAESERYVPRRFVQPVLRFMRLEASGGVLMLLAAIVAVVWANSPFGEGYFAIFETRIEIAFGEFHFHHLSELTVQEWINDAAMVIFFFVVGLEIKRELVVGELRDPKAAALPAVAAVGGMLLPAAAYLLFNAGGDAVQGWGIPMATDIAFAVGVVAMVGTRVPLGAKLFLLALAIVDDLGAILVIAIFYTEQVSLAWLLGAVAGLVAVYIMRQAGIRAIAAYIGVGALVWLCLLESGVHATIAGVALALLTPVTTLYSPRRFSPRAMRLVDRVDDYLPDEDHLNEVDHHTLERVSSLLDELSDLARETISPLDRLEHALSPWSSYVVIPLFALANAGVVISFGDLGSLMAEPVTLGVAVGLFVGKLVGVVGFAWIAVRLGLGRLPARTTWSHMVGVGMLAGIGFTVALFVASLAFSDPTFGDQAKVGIFAGSLLAGVGGYLWLRFGTPVLQENDVEDALEA